jgi:hypothetical protein
MYKYESKIKKIPLLMPRRKNLFRILLKVTLMLDLKMVFKIMIYIYLSIQMAITKRKKIIIL